MEIITEQTDTHTPTRTRTLTPTHRKMPGTKIRVTVGSPYTLYLLRLKCWYRNYTTQPC